MSAPTAIIDALESVIDIYLSGVRHRERAAFILCDNLVETACKAKAVQHDYHFDTSCGFHNALSAPGVQLPQSLKNKAEDYRTARNNMQHSSPAATVDAVYCATAILTAVKIIDRLWSNTSTKQFQPWMQVALRIVSLYSEEGNATKRGPFEDRMRKLPKMSIMPGNRDHWKETVRGQPTIIEELLNELAIA